jgi:anti-sigma B factor antagonist
VPERQGGSVMLNIIQTKDEKKLVIRLEGRLDTVTAPELEETLKECLNDVDDLVYDMEKLEYISSAGLRLLLTSQKTMNRQGAMSLINVNDEVMEILEITGFSDILSIEKAV